MGDRSEEPSMEDILSSIRRVITRDDAPGEALADPPAASDDVLDLHDEPAAPPPRPRPATDKLVSTASAEAARQSLESLTAAVTPATPGGPTMGARSIEEVVVDALRPMLKDWLDANLPQMVEAMVDKEIGRITGRD